MTRHGRVVSTEVLIALGLTSALIGFAVGLVVG